MVRWRSVKFQDRRLDPRLPSQAALLRKIFGFSSLPVWNCQWTFCVNAKVGCVREFNENSSASPCIGQNYLTPGPFFIWIKV